MSIESILGITASIISIGGVIYTCFNRLKAKSLTHLMKQLADRHTPIKKQKKILRSINRSLAIHNIRISNQYIQKFFADGRSAYAIFHDICIQNNIEPTFDLCTKLLGYDDKLFRKEWANRYAKKAPKEDSSPKGKQVVYMSELLREKFPRACKNLTEVLDKYGITYLFLKGTRDIWCRDYMPVQTASGKLVQFRYDPSYLKGDKEYEDSRSNAREVCRANGIEPIFSDINLDGGNVLICQNKAIISDRVFSENPGMDAAKLKDELARLLEADIIIIPTVNGDYTGHADGMVRFVNTETILGNNRDDEYKYWREEINKVLSDNGLQYIDFPFFYSYKDKAHPEHAIGIYVNYLEVGDLIIMPKFGVPGNKDAEALAKMKEIFPNKIIESIDYNEVALEGGVLNCSTWTIFQ